MLIPHPLTSTCHVTTICEIRSVQLYPIQIYAGGPKIKKLAPGPDHAPFAGAYFVMHEMRLVKVCPYTKVDISSFTHSRFMEGGLKLTILPLDPDHALFGDILSCMRWDLPRFIRTSNLKFLASPVQNLGKGF